MAELIGITSGVTTLVGLTLTITQVSYEYVQKVRKTSTSTTRYLQEVLALSSTLLRLQDTLKLPSVASILSADKDLLSDSLIAECQKELEAIKTKLQKPRPGFALSLHALTWPFEEKKAKEVVERLARWNSIFNSIVNTCNLSVLRIFIYATTDFPGVYQLPRSS